MTKFLLALFMIVFSIYFLNSAVPAKAQFDSILPSICDSKTENSAACNEIERGVNESNPVTSTSQNIANFISLIIGLTAIIIILIAGITMALSQGDSSRVRSSRDAIIYAAVGLVVVVLARAIVFFIVNRTR